MRQAFEWSGRGGIVGGRHMRVRDSEWRRRGALPRAVPEAADDRA